MYPELNPSDNKDYDDKEQGPTENQKTQNSIRITPSYYDTFYNK